MRKNVSTSTIDQFFALVRASLWQVPADYAVFKNCQVDWGAIGELSRQQTVVSLVFNGAMSLPQELYPPKEWLYMAYSGYERNRRIHFLLDKCVAEATKKLKESGIGSVLLKGQAYARYYPEAQLRQCGDIDLYVGDSNYLSAYNLSREFGWEEKEKFGVDGKHHICSFGNVTVELHRVAGQMWNKSDDRKFQDWSRRQLSSGLRNISIGGEEIQIPGPVFDVIFVFIHLYNHFLFRGIGLRQICDWALILHANCRDIDCVELEKLLKDFRLFDAWKSFTPIAVERLGLPEEECPFYSSEYGKKSERILSFILKDGNFGRYADDKFKLPDGYIRRKVYCFRWISKNLFSRFFIDPQNVMMCYLDFICKGMKRLGCELLKGTDR